MSREKQIEEMGKIIQKCDDEAMYASIADSLYDAGYRKQHISEGDPSNELIEIVKPYVSGCACEEESGSCELTDCRSCNALNLAKEIYNEGYRKQSENVIELPCKVGDKVYVLSQKSIQEYTVHAIEFNENTTTIKCHSWLAERENLLHKHIAYFNKTDFDKIVFLTKEEAEAKMKGGAE